MDGRLQLRCEPANSTFQLTAGPHKTLGNAPEREPATIARGFLEGQGTRKDVYILVSKARANSALEMLITLERSPPTARKVSAQCSRLTSEEGGHQSVLRRGSVATAQSRNSISVGSPWLPDSQAILMNELLTAGSEDSAHSRSEELIRALHPKMKAAAIEAKLTGNTPDGSPPWLTAAFWIREIDLVLLEGIHNGRHGQGNVIARLCDTWPQLDANVLKERMEGLANRGLPNFLHDEFWREEGIDPILMAGLKAGGQAIFLAVGKVERMYRDLRVEVIWARVQRLRKQSSRKRGKGARCTWTKEQEQELQARCADAGLSVAVTEICKKTGWSWAAVVRRSHALGVPTEVRGQRSPWTEADRNFLVQSIRHVPVKAIARELGRTENAVWCKVWEEGLRARYEADHSQRELCWKLNVRAPVVRGWIAKGWLKLGRNNRVKDRSLKVFFEKHREAINWERVDRAWIDEVIGNANSDESTDEQATEHVPELPGATQQDRSSDPCNSASGPHRTATSRRARGQGEDPEPQNSRARAASPRP